MQAIILAAGMGKRLGKLTQSDTKCMIKVNGITLISRMLSQLDPKSLSKIVIVVGYKKERLIEYIGTLGINTPIEYVENPIYDKTNNIYSLSLAKEKLCEEETLLLESDLIFEDAVLDEIIDDWRENLALVDKYESWMDGTCIKLGKNDKIREFISGKKLEFEEIKDYYKTVNIYKFSKEFSKNTYVPFLEAYTKALGNNEYYEQVLRVITLVDDAELRVKRLDGQLWYEIDDVQDLDIAESMFNPDEDKKVLAMHERYGGYWRYPKLIDFCYLVNPYFPPDRLMGEIKANFEKLVTQYPSGLQVNSGLAAKNFKVEPENIVVGNGAAELIKEFTNYVKGQTGLVRPTFEEYSNRCGEEKSIYFVPDNEDFSYSASEVMEFFADKKIDNLVIVNPDNPTGNYLPKKDVLKLVAWTKKKGIRLLIDESFVDFADEKDATLIDKEILDKNENLYVIKSISKTNGVPGLRLGVLASGDVAMIAKLKAEAAIWNINSLAEFYMQIEEKYHNDYQKSLALLRQERTRFEAELGKIKGLRMIPSQANYVMVEIIGGFSAKELTKRLLIKHNIFIKDLSEKLGGKQYVRLAIRDVKDNNKLLAALKIESKGDDNKEDTKNLNITVVGGGNVGTQFATHSAAVGHNVKIYSPRYKEFKKHLEVVDGDGNIIHKGAIKTVTNDAKVAFADADVIFVTVPAQRMEEAAKKIEPFAKAGKIIGLIPGTGGGEFAFGNCQIKGATVFGLQRIPSVARLERYGKSVRATGYREEIFLSVIRKENEKRCCEIISQLFAIPCKKIADYLNILLTPSNQILHTARLFAIFKEYKKGTAYPRSKLFYEEWDDESSKLLLKCDEEIQGICNKMKGFDLTYVNSLKKHYEVRNAKELTEKIRSIKGFKGIETPMVEVEDGWKPDFSSRYFVADFPFGLAILIQIATMVGAEVPTMKRIYNWFNSLGIECEKFDFATYGISNYDDLKRFYQG